MVNIWLGSMNAADALRVELHINAPDKVTQRQVVSAVEHIVEKWLGKVAGAGALNPGMSESGGAAAQRLVEGARPTEKSSRE